MQKTSANNAAIANENLRVLSGRTAWDKRDFLCALNSCDVVRRYPEYLPETIDMPFFNPVLDRLADLTNTTGLEHGRIGYLKQVSGSLIMGKTQVGDKSSISMMLEIGKIVDNELCTPMIMFHSHPAYGEAFVPGQEDHLSGPDMYSFMVTPCLLATLVRTPHRTLMAVKTSSSHSISPSKIATRIGEIEKEGFELSHFDLSKRSKILTKLYCIHFGLSLYVQEQGAIQAKKVKLFR